MFYQISKTFRLLTKHNNIYKRLFLIIFMAFKFIQGIKKLSSGLLEKLTEVRTPTKQESEERERQKFRNFIKNHYNISESRLGKLTEIVEYAYQDSNRLKSRKDLLKEEQEFSRQYKQFQRDLQQNPNNFIAKSINERVNTLYRKNKGRKSVARIFNELKQDETFNIVFRYNSKANRYEVNINEGAEDIRDLTILKIQKQVNFRKANLVQEDYNEGRISEPQKQMIKKNIIHSLDYYTARYTDELKNMGFAVNHNGVDSVLEEKYSVSQRKIPRNLKFLLKSSLSCTLSQEQPLYYTSSQESSLSLTSPKYDEKYCSLELVGVN